MNTHRYPQVLALLALAAAGVAPGCHHGKPTVERKASAGAVPSAPASDTVAPGRIVAPGIVEAWNGEVRLSAHEPGWIAEILVHEGQAISAGQLLARLDDDVQRRAVEIARADVAEAAAQVIKISRGSTEEELRQASADYDAAESEALLAASERERAARLHAADAITTADMDRAAARAKAQAAALSAAGARRSAARRGPRAEDRTIARRRLAAARARLEQAGTALERRHVVAPIAGTVLVSRFHVGEFFAVGAGPLFLLGDTSRLQIRLEVDEVDSPHVVPGVPCSIHLDENTKVAEGRIVRVSPTMGRRNLSAETPTERNDVRVREIFVEVPGSVPLVPGQRVWARTAAPVVAGLF